MFQLAIPIGLLLAIDLYAFQLLRTVFADFSDSTRLMVFILYWVLNLMAISALIYSTFTEGLTNYARYYVFSLLMLLVIPKLVGILFLAGEDAYRLVVKTISMFGEQTESSIPGRREFVSKLGLAVAAVPFAAMLYGMARTGFQITVRRQQVWFDDLPEAFDRLKIVQISDLHSGSFNTSAFFEKAVEKVSSLKPDLIFFTGDLVNNQATEAEPFVSTFSKLSAPLGVFSILGNHDYGNYGPWPSAEAREENFKRLQNVHRDSGWTLLRNESEILKRGNAELAVVGVENWGSSRHFPKYGDLDKAVESVNETSFKILLSHDPSHWDAQVKNHPQKFQLTLSGHTHGAQFGIEIPGFKWSPAKYIYKQWAGLYEESDGQKIYVNRGLGFIGYMGRIGIPPEITFLELRSKKNA
jgi:predicted MPP superfamily phosphohydrolase